MSLVATPKSRSLACVLRELTGRLAIRKLAFESNASTPGTSLSRLVSQARSLLTDAIHLRTSTPRVSIAIAIAAAMLLMGYGY